MSCKVVSVENQPGGDERRECGGALSATDGADLKRNNCKVFVALSGGVDSAVAAFLLKNRGYDCEGFTLQMFDGASQIADAQAVAEHLGIPFRVIDARERFARCVTSPFASGYLCGRTPNPCVDCNRDVKFGMMFEEIPEGSLLATGHYARAEDGFLYRTADGAKDQSYSLYTLTRRQLRRVLFPLGGLTKSEVRAVAAENGLPCAGKSESQDICFVPDGDYAAFIEKQTGKLSPPGDFTDADGNVLGRHGGIIRSTIGRRKGFGISFNKRMYVTAKDAQSNTITLGGEADLLSKVLRAGKVNWICDVPAGQTLRLRAKARYNQKEAAWAEISPENGMDFILGMEIRVCFDDFQRAITPGQHVVFYSADGDRVIGGGEIMN